MKVNIGTRSSIGGASPINKQRRYALIIRNGVYPSDLPEGCNIWGKNSPQTRLGM